jgi:hypothetical protein
MANPSAGKSFQNPYQPGSPEYTAWNKVNADSASVAPDASGALDPSVYGGGWATAYNNFSGAQTQPGQLKLGHVADTTMASLDDDPTRKAQMAALDNMQNVMNYNGLTPQDQQQLQTIKNQQATAEQGQRGAIMQNARARGVGGSGLQMASLLNAQSSGAGSAAVAGTNVAANAQARKDSAAQSVGTLGGQVRGQDYTRAQAADYINQFNTGIDNQVAQWNQVGSQQQGFQNFMDLATARANVLQAREGQGTQQRGQTMGLVGQLGAGALSSGNGK